MSENDHFFGIDFEFSGDLDGGERGAMSIMTLAGNIRILFFQLVDVRRFSCTAPDIGGRCRCLLYFSVLSERK